MPVLGAVRGGASVLSWLLSFVLWHPWLPSSKVRLRPLVSHEQW
jgi:hypothetical protein